MSHNNPQRLEYPVVEIPSSEPNPERTQAYTEALGIIQTGIARSIESELPAYMVHVGLAETHLRPAGIYEISLGEYLAGAGLSKKITSKEYAALLATYNPLNEAYQALHIKELEAIEPRQPSNAEPSSTAGRIAKVATKASWTPLVFTTPEGPYIDYRLLAANDRNND